MTQLVFIENGKTVTDSLTVAEVFGKDHDKVMRDIRSLDCSLEFSTANFGESTYMNDRGRTYSKYTITQDGFTFLVMGYTGKEAARFKELYIAEFNRMREQLSSPAVPQTPLEVLQASITHLVTIEREQAAQAERLAAVEKRQEHIHEVLSLNPIDGRKKVNKLLNKIAKALGGEGSYHDIRTESYRQLEFRAACSLSIRQENKRKKMALAGAHKSKIDQVSKLDVIFDDGRLTEIYFAVVKEMAIANKVDPGDVAAS
ncbi:hypothetical protein YDYSY3_57400 [Paenibacillus chitinolyticus]|uniref:Rha family transcriptional regulator n=1 Tax=Paenibacillus chitinolyticus TaxID=79263 RepID=UPI0026E4ED4D|nr:Rha family transcriptional regulator [Paenibacillus chitinolyticus]GKS14740.1 hypothetical protein YDYSY3_57400 [Paenibacillus chitinolyticus]